MKRQVLGVVAAVLGTVMVSGAGLYSAASAADPAATTVTLPLFGAPLTIGITSGPGGALANVSVDSANPTVATKLKPHKVVFQSTSAANPTADPARIVVKSGKGGQSVSARAGSLADVAGPGSWKGDVWGDTLLTTVPFTVVALADGSPDITVGTPIVAAGVTAVVGTVDHSSGDGHEDESGSSARVSVKFTNATGDQSRRLTISVRIRTKEGGDTSAKLGISLSRIKGVAIDAGAAAGSHKWSGTLCNSSPARIDYMVAADGSVSAVTSSVASADVRTDGGKIDVRFSDNERVRINVKFDNGMIRISVQERIRCDSPNPTTNVSTSIPADNGHGDHQGGDNQGGRDNHGHGDHNGG